MKRQFLCVLCLHVILIGCQKTESLGQSVPIEPSQSPAIQTALPTPTQEAAEFEFPEGEILFSDLLPEEWNEMIITISDISCKITIKPTKEYAERFLDSIKDQELYSEFEPLHGAGGQVVVLSMTEDNGREYRFRDYNEITVNIDSVSKIYGTEKNGEYRDILLDASTLFFYER